MVEEKQELHTFMITSYTSSAINGAFRFDSPFTWKYMSLTLKQQGRMTQPESTRLSKNAKILLLGYRTTNYIA
jgi:hypothetical protein